MNNPQLSSLRESYLSAKTTVPQINAPANPQVGLAWSGMLVHWPFALGGANAPSQQYSGGICSNNSISVAQPFQFPGTKSLVVDIADTNAEALLSREKLVLRGDVRRAMTAVPTFIELEEYAENSYPSLKSSALQLDAAGKGVDLAKKAYLPDFQVIGSSYTLRGPFSANNGALFYQFELDLIIPLYFFAKEKYGVEQAQRNQAAAEVGYISISSTNRIGCQYCLCNL